MGLCGKLNCCSSGGKKSKPKASCQGKGGDGVADDGSHPAKTPETHGNTDTTPNATHDTAVTPTAPNGINMNSKTDNEPIYAKVDKRRSKNHADFPVLKPKRGNFLVSFVVDSRGGAMTGNRGSGLRIIFPPGAVEQPARITCKFIRPTSHHLQSPPPIMERDALASGVLEVGPVGSVFKQPVLIEVPHSASLSSGVRELVVLRSDDGETWTEHEMAATNTFIYENSWKGPEAELYEDVVSKVHLEAAVEDLHTKRLVRLSTHSFPKYFAVLSRVKGEVKSIGAEGGTVKATTSATNQVSVSFPENALKKKIKIGLQLQEPDPGLVSLIDKKGIIMDVYPLIGVYPRRRRFHNPIEISVPIKNEAKTSEVKKIWIFCSLSSASEKAKWEDMSDQAAVTVKGKKFVFESRVTALFWLFTTKKDVGQEEMLDMASLLYKELLRSPYMARMAVYYRPQFPFAWCDALRIHCAVDDQMDNHLENKDDNWIKVLDMPDLEMEDKCTYRFQPQRGKSDLEFDSECQIEAKLDDRLVFRAFHDNTVTILVKRIGDDPGRRPSRCSLLMHRIRSSPSKSMELQGTFDLRFINMNGAAGEDSQHESKAAPTQALQPGTADLGEPDESYEVICIKSEDIDNNHPPSQGDHDPTTHVLQ